MNDRIREYWDSRAEASAGQPNATTDDVWLRELEVSTIVQTIKRLCPTARTLLDVGCGDGYSTLQVAERLDGVRIRGLDFSENMIALARQELDKRSLLARVRFDVGDATDLDTGCGAEVFDVVVTDRCLINLGSFERQRRAIHQISRHVRPGGTYLAIENFAEGQTAMNQARQAVGLPEIPIRWHNLFFTEEGLRTAADGVFQVNEWLDFASSYYLTTRVVYSKLCQMKGEQPDYRHEIHEIATHLPWTGRFSPIRMAILCRTTE